MKKRGEGVARRLTPALLTFAALLVCACLLVNLVGGAADGAETELVRAAVRSAAMTCYAVEGAYPQGLGYLKRHYGLMYDEDAYEVVYTAPDGNAAPEIQVYAKGGGKS